MDCEDWINCADYAFNLLAGGCEVIEGRFWSVEWGLWVDIDDVKCVLMRIECPIMDGYGQVYQSTIEEEIYQALPDAGWVL